MRRLLSRLFGKPAPPAPRTRPIPPGFDAVWQPGEIAECISGGDWRCCIDGSLETGPVTGERNRVVRVELHMHPFFGQRCAFLRFATHSGAFCCTAFRKVVPQADAAEAADAAFLASLKPARIPAPARPLEPAAARPLFDERRHPLSADPLTRAIAALEQEHARHD